LAAGLAAEVRQWDLTERNERIENKRFETDVRRPDSSPRWMAKRFDTSRFATDTHRLADERFEAGKIDLFRSRRFETPRLDYAKRERVWFPRKGKMLSKEELDEIRFNTLHHHAKKESMIADEGPAIDVEEFLDRLSLADLNRYQFRRSHPEKPGIPVQRAASEDVPEDGEE
jgi:hypothetical protein